MCVVSDRCICLKCCCLMCVVVGRVMRCIKFSDRLCLILRLFFVWVCLKEKLGLGRWLVCIRLVLVMFSLVKLVCRLGLWRRVICIVLLVLVSCVVLLVGLCSKVCMCLLLVWVCCGLWF